MSSATSISLTDVHGKELSLPLFLCRADNEAMTLSDCPICGRRELRGARSLHTVATRGGNLIGLTCRGCGTELTGGTNRVIRPATLHAVA
jgi:hypothetical protein